MTTVPSKFIFVYCNGKVYQAWTIIDLTIQVAYSNRYMREA